MNFGIYSATKAAFRSLTRTWANKLRSRSIRVNAISPGATDTEGFRELASGIGVDPVAFKEVAGGSIPLGRVGRPDEVADTVVFFASDLSTFITGAELFVDGGSHAICIVTSAPGRGRRRAEQRSDRARTKQLVAMRPKR